MRFSPLLLGLAILTGILVLYGILNRFAKAKNVPVWAITLYNSENQRIKQPIQSQKYKIDIVDKAHSVSVLDCDSTCNPKTASFYVLFLGKMPEGITLQITDLKTHESMHSRVTGGTTSLVFRPDR